MELKGEVRVIKKPNKNYYYGFTKTFILALLIGSVFYLEEISVFVKEKVDFSETLNPTVLPPTIAPNEKRQSVTIVDRGRKGDTPLDFLMNEANRSLVLGRYDIAATKVERAMTLAGIRLKQGKAELTEALAMKVISLSKADPFLKRRSWLLISQSRRLKGEVSDSEQAEVTALKSMQENEKNKLNTIIKKRLDEERKSTIQLEKFKERLQKVQSILVELEKNKAIALKEDSINEQTRKNTEFHLVEQELLASNKEIKKIKDEQKKEKGKLIVLQNKRKQFNENVQIESQLLRSKIEKEKKVLVALISKTKQVQKKTTLEKVLKIPKQFNKDSYIEFFPNGLKKTEFKAISNNKFIKMEWYANGMQHTFKEYLNGKQNGVWMAWDKNGDILETSTYDRGELINMLRPIQSQ